MNPLYLDREELERIEALSLVDVEEELPEVGEELDEEEALRFIATLGDDLLF